MLDKNEQIEEMAKAMHDGCAIVNATNQCRGKDCLDCGAVTLYEKGFRKASEVVREIFEEIEKMLLDNHIESFKNLNDEWVHRFKENLPKMLAGLKKKYI